ncbi:YbaB/EbfC family nucleoid-associated protein [Actinacidiphila oryziradicis]|uniref:YbaB/EbfC family nucleoid-associated protein n=1 Tax=Actinacidiphila oryziradicis TaxID=2571141 RepID=UPI001FE6291C|nr:YbaB/EbfC family nucleoid-associated protein [Actinacidiphila oryziradicis]
MDFPVVTQPDNCPDPGHRSQATGHRPPAHLVGGTNWSAATSLQQIGNATVASGRDLDIQDLLRQAQQIKQRLTTAQRELAESNTQGVAGGGLVKATVNGRGKLLNLEISSVIADPDNTDELARMIVSAVQDAHASLRALHQSAVGPIIDAFNAEPEDNRY